MFGGWRGEGKKYKIFVGNARRTVAANSFTVYTGALSGEGYGGAFWGGGYFLFAALGVCVVLRARGRDKKIKGWREK
jgi:hypothetical protein